MPIGVPISFFETPSPMPSMLNLVTKFGKIVGVWQSPWTVAYNIKSN